MISHDGHWPLICHQMRGMLTGHWCAAKHAIVHKTGVFTQTGVADWHSGNHHHPTVRATELQVALLACAVYTCTVTIRLLYNIGGYCTLVQTEGK